MVVNNNDNRERWILTNTSNMELSFGELPLLPTIATGESIDLLVYYEKDEVQQSKQIPMARAAGYISMQKILDDVSTEVENSDYTTVAERSIIEEIKDETIFDYIKLNPDLPANPDFTEGLIFYDKDNEALAVYNSESDITLQVGQEQWIYVYNNSGVDIVNGNAVRITGASAVLNRPEVSLANASTSGTSYAVGLATHNIANGTSGFITVLGVVRDFDTSLLTSGDEVWVSDTVDGGLTNVEPAISFSIGTVLISSATAGSVSVIPHVADFYTKSQVDNLIASVELGADPNLNVITVAKIADEYNPFVFVTVEDAIDEINSYAGSPEEATSTNKYVIHVSPGTFVENNPLVIPSYVTLQGWNDEASIVQADDDNAHLFEMDDDSQIYDLRTIGPANDDAILVDGGNSAEIIRVACKNALCGVHVDGVGTTLEIEESRFKSDVTTGMLSTDGASISCNSILSQAITTHFYANGGSIWMHNSGMSGGVNGLYANNAGIIDINGLTSIGVTNAIRANNASSVAGLGVETRDTGSWCVLQEDASIVDLSSCRFVATKISMFDASKVTLSFDSDLAGDEGMILYEELQVGSPERGREAVFGEGDSYTRGMMVYTETALGVFVDVSTAAASVSGSTFTFPGVAAENAIYVSSDLQDATDYKQFLGIKMASTTALVPGAGEVVAEYWDGTVGGGSWVEFRTFSAGSNSPYTPYANALFVRANSSEQIRFDDLCDTTRFDWAKNDPPTTGTSRFWIRFRVKTGVTTVPVFEQFKVHSNRTEINADGVVEHMGAARFKRIIESVNVRNTIPVVGKSPGNVPVDFGPIINLNATANQFANNASDGFGQLITIPYGLDTSIPLEYIVRWAPTTNVASGIVALDFTYGIGKVGVVLNGGNPETTDTQPITTTLNTANQIYETSFLLSIPTAVPENGLFMVLQRQAAGGTGPTGDTYGGNIYIVNLELFGTFWR